MADLTALDRPDIGRRLFHPRTDPAPVRPDADLFVLAPDGTRLYVRAHLADPGLPTLLLFHGNGEVASDYDGFAPLARRAGFNLAVGEFRGYGHGAGEATASRLAGDAEAVLDAVRKRLAATGFSPRLVVMGRSLGSACALSLAARRPEALDGLVIESGFANTLLLLAVLGVDRVGRGLTESDGFGNLEHAARFTGPTLFIHGGADDLIPPSEARLLYAASPAPDKRLLVIDGAGHNDLLAVGAGEYLGALAALAQGLPRP